MTAYAWHLKGRVGIPASDEFDSSPTRFWALRIALVAFARRRFFVGIAKIQFRMASLGLQHVRSFAELPRLTEISGLMFPLSSGWLVLPIASYIRHSACLSQTRGHPQRLGRANHHEQQASLKLIGNELIVITEIRQRAIADEIERISKTSTQHPT